MWGSTTPPKDKSSAPVTAPGVDFGRDDGDEDGAEGDAEDDGQHPVEVGALGLLHVLVEHRLGVVHHVAVAVVERITAAAKGKATPINQAAWLFFSFSIVRSPTGSSNSTVSSTVQRYRRRNEKASTARPTTWNRCFRLRF